MMSDESDHSRLEFFQERSDSEPVVEQFAEFKTIKPTLIIYPEWGGMRLSQTNCVSPVYFCASNRREIALLTEE